MAGATAEDEEHTTTTLMITKRMGRNVREASWAVLSPDKFCIFSVLYMEAFYDVAPELVSMYVHTHAILYNCDWDGE